jgi:diaminopimelate decarboxylase
MARKPTAKKLSMKGQPTEFFHYIGDELCVDGVIPVREIIRKMGTPTYIYSAEAMLHPLRELQTSLSDLPHLICFAVKSNSNLHVLKLMAAADAGMDLVSSGELKRALKAGVDPQKIVFSGVGKTRQEMREGIEAGILSFNVESVPELELLNEVARDLGVVAPVALRFNPDVDAKTHPYISTGLKKNKFGLDKAEVLSVVQHIKKKKLAFISLKGISIHIGSQILELSPLKDSFVRLRKLVDQIEKILPGALEFVDLGGGLGITYDREKTLPVAKYADAIHETFGKSSGLKRPLRIILEPGRSLVGNAGILVTEVLFRKVRKSRDFLIVDAAMNDLMRPALYGSFHALIPVAKNKSQGTTRTTDIVGPVCESSDCFASGRKLSKRIQPKDHLAILSAGAYGFSMSSSYNTRPRPPEILVENGTFRLIRRRETHEDLLAAEENL